MFLYDEDSQYCYFNPNSLEPSEQFFLVGVVLGLAIYNSTILDVALPPFAFRKLLAAAPQPTTPTSRTLFPPFPTAPQATRHNTN
jgi:E3 ubiquitin-protein ligase HECTD2